MYPGESARKFGSTHTNHIGGGHLIAEFPDAVSGAAAQFDLLNSSHYRNMSVGAAIGKWCGHNDASGYRNFLQHSGIDLKASVGEVMQDKDKAIALAKTMARVEAGKEYPLGKDQWGAAFDKFKEYSSSAVRADGDKTDRGMKPQLNDQGQRSEGERSDGERREDQRHEAARHEAARHEAARHEAESHRRHHSQHHGDGHHVARQHFSAPRHVVHHRRHHRWE
jgi:hypothetical protein